MVVGYKNETDKRDRDKRNCYIILNKIKNYCNFSSFFVYIIYGIMRKPRQYSKTHFYHVVIRGVNKQNIFFDNEDKNLFLGLLKKYSSKLNIKVYAYCLMDNHVHLEIEDEDKNISLFMQCICSIYARLFNKKYDRIGHLFQERFASEVIKNTSHFLTVFRYILQNPQKASICSIEKFLWSSYLCYKKKSTFIQKEFLLKSFGTQKKLYDFLHQQTNELCLEIELRPSEKEAKYIEKIKNILETENPIIQPDLPMNIIKQKVKKLKRAGLSIRTISRVTGISKHIVQNA